MPTAINDGDGGLEVREKINDAFEQLIPPGGTTGQVLTKASDADGDADWEDGAPQALVAGADSMSGTGGTAAVTGGTGAYGGDVTITSGPGTVGGAGGVLITASDGATDGGAVTIAAGSAGDGLGGNVFIRAGAGAGDADGNIILTLPTSDPLVAGAIFSDGVPSPGVPKALMISGG